jgi:endonuclease-3
MQATHEDLGAGITAALALAERAVSGYRKAALFELYEDGFTSPFEILCACIISIRTLDEVTVPVARALFACGRTPEAIARLSVKRLSAVLRGATFHTAKAQQIKDIAEHCRDAYDGTLPCDRDALLALRGVGPKCAGLVLGIACGQKHIGVDVHVHRVCNRWGFVHTTTPEKTMSVLERILPRAHWVRINAVLVPFGKHVCTGKLPHCSQCPVRPLCAQVGVTAHR